MDELERGVANLHDVFLNASLMRDCMRRSPLPKGHDRAAEFMMSNRGRFERAWVTALFVLVEAWQAPPWRPVRQHLSASTSSTSALNAVLEEARASGHIDKMRETRNYMCHRDRRDYWDTGRLAVAGKLGVNEAMHKAFGKVFQDFFEKCRSGT